MRSSAIILDANLLILLIVGQASVGYIAKHRRLQGYTVADFELLLDLIPATSRIVVTPNTLTETSNLMRYIAEPARTHISEIFRVLVQGTDERYCASERAIAREEFVLLGLTDAVLLDLAHEAHVLLTTDLDLYLAALAQGLDARNFNHYRTL